MVLTGKLRVVDAVAGSLRFATISAVPFAVSPAPTKHTLGISNLIPVFFHSFTLLVQTRPSTFRIDVSVPDERIRLATVQYHHQLVFLRDGQWASMFS